MTGAGDVMDEQTYNDLRLVVMSAVGFNMGFGARPDRDPKGTADIWEACERIGAMCGLTVNSLGWVDIAPEES